MHNTERRNRNERRRGDYGPPKGCAERRRRAERRLPDVAETDISAAEWEHFFGRVATTSNTHNPLLEQAADVFDRVRGSH
jgi:hypothetical protein